MGPLIFGPKRFVDPAINLDELPKIDLFLLTHNHYDHLSTRTINKFPYKKTKVLATEHPRAQKRYKFISFLGHGAS